MPLVYHEWIQHDLQIGLWKITESIDELISMLFLNKEEFDTLESFGNDARRKQWLSYRALIRNLVKADYIYRIYYDKNNKPYLVNPQRAISISHCSDYAVVLISEDVNSNYGIDIEPVNSKILKVVEKFMNKEELCEWEKTKNLEKAIAYWTFKEAIFKAFGKKTITLKGNIHINPFSLDDTAFEGSITKRKLNFKYNLQLRRFQNIFISFAKKV